MRGPKPIWWPVPALLLIGVLAAARPGHPLSNRDILPAGQALSEAEIRQLAERAIAHQHRDDLALMEYERLEHRQTRTSGAAPKTTDDKLYRVVPTGTGTLKLLLRDNGKPVDAAVYRQSLEMYARTLEIATHADDPREKESLAKWQKRSKERSDLVDATLRAFRANYLGREALYGRQTIKLHLEPNPEFRPRSRNEEILTHARVTMWIDEKTEHLVRADAEIISDISFGGGVLGKVYRGGRIQFDQAEVAPDVWLPVHYQYDFSARKLLFGFEVHDLTEVSRYRRLGPPAQALPVVKAELAGGAGVPGDPP